MRPFILLLTLVLPLSSLAQQSKGSEEETLKELSHDLAALQHVLREADAQRAEASRSLLFSTIQITAGSVPLRAGAASTADPLGTAAKGETFRVIDKAQDWYAVRLDRTTKGQDVAWVSASGAAPTFRPIARRPADASDVIYNTVSEQLRQIKEKYKNNDYIIVKGFSISLGINTSVSVSFEFKQ